MAKTPRQIALEILIEVGSKKCFADPLLNRSLSGNAIPKKQDRTLLFELVKGTLRRQGEIDTYLNQISSRPVDTVPIKIQNTLRLGAYQILYLDRVPDRAAVDESSKLARIVGHEGHVRFVNGILRNLIRKREDLSLPDPSDTLAYLAVTQSFPAWIVKRWVERFGADDAARLLEACNEQADLTLRVNTLNVSKDELMAAFVKSGHDLQSHPWIPGALVIKDHVEIRELPGYDKGWFYVQDPAAMAVSLLTGAEPGERILDACAAPGGKSSHLAELMEDRGEVIALDVDPEKLPIIQENMTRLALNSVQVEEGDASTMQFHKPFDRILVDAPCSGLGTIRRHPEAKWIKKEEDLVGHQKRQLAILENVSNFLKTEGILVYATCSTEPEENEAVIEKFLEVSPEFKIDKEASLLESHVQNLLDENGYLHTYPHTHGTDGFFAVRLIKTS